MTIKLDASGLIYLTKADLLKLVMALHGEVVITEPVYQEAVMRGKPAGYPDALAVEKAIADRQMRVVQLSQAAQERLTAAGFSDRLGLRREPSA